MHTRKHPVWLLTLTALAALTLPGVVWAQQSTTGPVPPPGLDLGRRASSPGDSVIPGVPAYLWHHGCCPTALGMVIGYWDGLGYPDLVRGPAQMQTAYVDSMIADDSGLPNCDLTHQDHYQDYSCPIDSVGPILADQSQPGGSPHPNDCVADFMRTSWSFLSNRYGFSWLTDVPIAFTAYSNFAASYTPTTATYAFPAFPWWYYKCEIDLGRPMVLEVDANGDGDANHCVTAVGYNDSTGEYGCYDTWERDVGWHPWVPMAPGTQWGVANIVTFAYGQVECCPDPALCTVDPCDSYNGIITSPTPSPGDEFEFAVTVVCASGLPAVNMNVDVYLGDPENHYVCDPATFHGTTDALGVVTFNLSAGGCTIGQNAVWIDAGVVTMRTYQNIRSPDWAPLSDGDVDLSDFIFFGGYYGLPGGGCVDYDDNGEVMLLDFSRFARAWGRRCR
ncbi:MAG: hypothetical protein KAY32_03240 [Candidatus Eisenbacteria sp.]|nr:hypothetical protein [Candidatus Eisenbacteria bacterium]